MSNITVTWDDGSTSTYNGCSNVSFSNGILSFTHDDKSHNLNWNKMRGYTQADADG